MKNLVDICLIVAMTVIVYGTNEWWAIMAFMPFMLLAMRYSPDRKPDENNEISSSEMGNYIYIVTMDGGETMEVACNWPVRYEDGWAFFADDMRVDGTVYPSNSFYRPKQVMLKSVTRSPIAP